MIIDICTIGIAICSFGFTLYYSILYPRKKSCKAKLVWDDLLNEYYIIIWNTGRVAYVPDSIELYYNSEGERVSIGKRESLFNNGEGNKALMPGEAFRHVPVEGSIYDIFAYKGHYFDVDETNRKETIYIEIKGLYGETYNFKTQMTLEEIDERI